MSDADNPSRPLANRGFLSLVITQFFGVVNDNLLKQVLTFGLAAAGVERRVGRGRSKLGGHGAGDAVSPVRCHRGAVGRSLQQQLVTLRVKQAEFLIVVVAFAGFISTTSGWLCWRCFLPAPKSAFFGPAKYGVIPELVADSKISIANATIIMLTNVAAILAVVVGGALRGLSRSGGRWRAGWPALAARRGTLIFAVLGLISAKQMPALPASAPGMKVQWNFFAPYIQTIRKMLAGETPILVVCVLKAMFYLLAYLAMLILADYTLVLGISEKKVSLYLFGTIGVSIAVGSVLAGVISRGGIQPRLILAGGMGFGIASLLLALAPSSYVVIHPADEERAAQGVAGLPEGAKVSYYLERSKDRLVELRADLKLHQEGIALDQRLQDVQDGNYQAMVISSAYLNTFPNRKVSPDKDSNGTEFYHLTEGESKNRLGWWPCRWSRARTIFGLWWAASSWSAPVRACMSRRCRHCCKSCRRWIHAANTSPPPTPSIPCWKWVALACSFCCVISAWARRRFFISSCWSPV